MADKVELGRVQGVGMFYTSAICTSTTTTIAVSSIVPNDVTVFVGDKVLCSTGELFTVTSINSSNLTVIYVTSLMGARGEDGTSFEILYQVDSVNDLPTPTAELLGKAYAVGKESPHEIYVVAIDSSSNYYWLNLGQMQGPKGDKGDAGNAATVDVGTVETLESDGTVYVNNSGDTHDAIFDFGIPRGEQGEKGDTGLTPSISVTASIDQTVGTAIVVADRSGSNEEPVLDFRFSGIKGEVGAQGRAATIEIGEVETLESDGQAYVDNVGDTIDAKFNFGIPRGVQGVGITGAHIDSENNLTFDLSNGNTISAGKVIPATSIYLAVARDNSTGLIHDFGILYNGTVTIDNLQYKSIAEHELCVSAYLDVSSTTVTIPDTIEIYTLSSYSDEYTIDEFSVVSIESSVFQNHTELTTVVISDNVRSIGDYCFDGCTKLTTISFGSIASISLCAFRNCSSLKSVTLPNTCTELHAGCFAECNSLTSVTLPDSLLTIGSANDTVYPGFSNTSITSLTIPANVTSILEGFFGGMSSLSAVTYNARNAELSLFNPGHYFSGIFFSNNTYGADASNLSITFGTTVQTIGMYMFTDTNMFVSITFNSGCTSIGDRAFDCSSLRTYPSNVCSLTLPNTLLTIGDRAFDCCAVFNSVIIPDSVISIGASAFYYTGYNVTQASEIRLGKSVSSIGANCFYNHNSSRYPLTIGFYNSGSFTIDSGAFNVSSSSYIGTITVNYVGSASDWSSKVSGSGVSGTMLTSATWNYNVSG